jgi:hypothetical protein
MNAAVLSPTFRFELLKRRAAGQRVCDIARAANVRANELSGLANGSIKARRTDPRIARVAAVLGLPLDDCFEADVPCGTPASESREVTP